MEKVAVTIILIVVWIIVGAVKDARSSRRASTHSDRTPGHDKPNPWKLLEEQERELNRQPAGQRHEATAAMTVEAPKRKPATAKKMKRPTLPVEGGSALKRVPMPEEPAADIDAFDAGHPVDVEKPAALTPEEQARRKAHFDRWRRAIVDAQILQPKF